MVSFQKKRDLLCMAPSWAAFFLESRVDVRLPLYLRTYERVNNKTPENLISQWKLQLVHYREAACCTYSGLLALVDLKSCIDRDLFDLCL